MRPHAPSSQRPHAFTLLEVLIAVVSFAIVLAAINGVFYGALRLRAKAAESAERFRPLQRALDVIKNDLASIVPPGTTLAGPLQTTALTNLVAGRISPDFYTASANIDPWTPWADIQRVSYALVQPQSRSGGLDLVRLVTRNLLPVEGDEMPFQDSLLSGVHSVIFSFYTGSQWQTTWDSTTPEPVTGLTNTLPAAVKVQIHLAAADTGRPLAFAAPVELVVPLAAQSRTVPASSSTTASREGT
jgi:type II secretion system protein J